MKKTLIIFAFSLILLLAVGQFTFADSCDKLNGKTHCVTFKYSDGGSSNSHTATFNNGNFTLGGSAVGTYTCKGKNFVEINYEWPGPQGHVWYGKAKRKGDKIVGYGKSTLFGYLYSFKSVPGACAAGESDATEGDLQKQ